MKKAITLVLGIIVAIGQLMAHTDGDTVVIELNNKSKVVVYTEDREALRDLQRYDINEMIKDLNTALRSSKVEKIELQDANGEKYLKDTTLIFGDNSAKTKIKVGNMELLVDADDWDELEDEFDDEDLPIRRFQYEEESIDRTQNFFNVDIGLNNWMQGSTFPDETNNAYAVKPWGSWYIGLNSVNKTWITGPLFMEWGMGVSWYNWKMQESNTLIEKGADRIEFNPTPATYNSSMSKLSVPYINISMIPMLDFAQGKRKVKNLERGSVSFRTYKKQGLRFGVGPYAGYRVGGRTVLKYVEDGDKEKDKNSGNYFLTNFRYGLRAQVGFKGLDLFASYDLNNVFATDRGPAGSNGLNAVTFGIIL
ncbi:MAG: hypothetical protein ACJAVY_001697 [Marinoscillum sp.]|jgi:hypothetical protein